MWLQQPNLMLAFFPILMLTLAQFSLLLANVLLTSGANMQGPTAMPAFNSAGYNTSKFAYPDTDHGHDVFYNEYQDIEVREYHVGMFLWHHATCLQNRNAA